MQKRVFIKHFTFGMIDIRVNLKKEGLFQEYLLSKGVPGEMQIVDK